MGIEYSMKKVTRVPLGTSPLHELKQLLQNAVTLKNQGSRESGLPQFKEA